MSPPAHRTARHRHRHRELGLRRISSATRGFAAASFALVGVFTAMAAHASSKATARTGVPAATPPARSNALPGAAVGTLPPDTFPSSGANTPPTAATVPLQPPQTAPQGAPDTVPQTLPPIVSGAS